jgi:ribosome-binding factor A
MGHTSDGKSERPGRIAVSERHLKVAEVIKLSIVDALRKGKVKDARLTQTSVTITRVTVSPDLKIATCYVLPFGYSCGLDTHKLSVNELLNALEASKYGLRAWVARDVVLKYSPELRFSYDHGFENSNRVEQLLQSNINDDGKY